MNNPENAHAKSLIVNYVVIILLLSLLWLLYEGVRIFNHFFHLIFLRILDTRSVNVQENKILIQMIMM